MLIIRDPFDTIERRIKKKAWWRVLLKQYQQKEIYFLLIKDGLSEISQSKLYSKDHLLKKTIERVVFDNNCVKK